MSDESNNYIDISKISKFKGGVIGLLLTVMVTFGGISVKDVYQSQIMIEELSQKHNHMQEKLDTKLETLQHMETAVAIQGIKLENIQDDVKEIKQDVKKMLERSNHINH